MAIKFNPNTQKWDVDLQKTGMRRVRKSGFKTEADARFFQSGLIARHSSAESNLDHILASVIRRYDSIIDQPGLLSAEEQETLNFLTDEIHKIAKIKVTSSGKHAGKGRPAGVRNCEGKKHSQRKTNDVSELTADDFKAFREKHLYPHQQKWYDAGQDPETRRTRFILKSRKIGATWFFAYEAFEDAVLNGNDQAFVSATRGQAELFKGFISAIALEYFDVTLRGNPMVLLNDKKEMTLHFLSNNVSSAQGMGGNVYFDEAFWTRNFTNPAETGLFDVAAPIATFTKHRRTIISTPSAISHSAHPKWTGAEYNKDRPKAEHIDINTSHKALKNGALGDDGIWRQVVTLEDAVNSGFDRINIDQIKRENSPSKFKVYYCCQFVDDANSFFSLAKLMSMGRDKYKPPGLNLNSDRPYGNRQTTAGYDPGGKTHFDAAALLNVPTAGNDRFWLLEHHMMKNLPSFEQFAKIREWYQRYHLIHFEFDTTGPGQDMEKYATAEFPDCLPVRYTPEYKTAMVNKAAAIFAADRFRYDINHTEVALSFMTIKQGVTPVTGQITYTSSESDEVGHGDLAWAIMHAFMVEDLNPENNADHADDVVELG